ncbi:periplasmic heavy metal sensor [Tabrizicola sp.]|uniref:periplasmic heavy metal sensor n=1 Tax=Tabrizicola sp. TaxID=2005166 RepID=UPI003F30AB6B
MTENPAPPPTAPVPPAPASRGLKIAFALSLALNLAVAGLAVGAWLSVGPQRGMPRDLSFGPFSAAFSDEDRRALRRGLAEHAGEFRQDREAARAEFETLVATLRAEPFDAEAAKTALATIEARYAERLTLGRSLIEARILEMSPADRAAFADRLENGMQRKGGKD